MFVGMAPPQPPFIINVPLFLLFFKGSIGSPQPPRIIRFLERCFLLRLVLRFLILCFLELVNREKKDLIVPIIYNNYKIYLLYMETEKTIITNIPIQEIIQKTLENNPKSKCEFNNLLCFNAVNLFLDNLNVELNETDKLTNYTGGKSKSRKHRARKIKRKNYRKTRKQRKYKGGADPRSIIFFMSMFFILAEGIKNMTHFDVTNRLKQTMRTIDLFKNYYGTCSLNTMLFLKAIDLPTFEDLSIQLMDTKKGLTRQEMSSYLNKELSFDTKWYIFSGSNEEDEEAGIRRFIDKVRSKLISMRSDYGFGPQQEILTALNYPTKRGSYHAVTVWLTNKNEIVIIDPQRYYVENQILLYTSEAYSDRYMDGDKQLMMTPIETYIRERIDVTSDYRDTEVLLSLHIEIEDIKGRNRLDPSNKELQNVIGKIRNAEEKLLDRERIEF